MSFASLPPAAWAALHRLPCITPTILFQLLAAHHLPTISDWSIGDLREAGLEPEIAGRVWQETRQLDIAQVDRWLQENQVTLVPFSSAEYPWLLKNISSPPPLLYVKGSVDSLSLPALAVVGTRHPSEYGIQMTERVMGQLTGSNICIVSGLAYGIDITAHQAALTAGLPTVAVMGNGIDRVYPSSHSSIAQKIISSGGAIVTEFRLGAEPDRVHFPQRNRVIAGLSKAVWLVEAPARSGALITMKFGLDENRDLYALPGDVTREMSHGPLNWIRLGAGIVTTASDFQPTFPTVSAADLPEASAFVSVSEIERQILRALDQHSGRHIDEIIEACRLEASVIVANVALLEVRGLIRHLGGMRYVCLTPLRPRRTNPPAD